MGTTSVVMVVVAFLLLFAASGLFRDAANEFYGHYVLNFLRLAWPYFLIWAARELIENRDLSVTFHDIKVANPYLAQTIVGGVALFLILMVTSKLFRDRANEIYGHYVLNFLRLAWPYVAIVVACEVISDGSATAFVHRLAG